MTDTESSPRTGVAAAGESAAAPVSIDDIVGAIFDSQAALARSYARAIEYRCGCVDGCSRSGCDGSGFITR